MSGPETQVNISLSGPETQVNINFHAVISSSFYQSWTQLENSVAKQFFSQNCDISFHRIETFLFTELQHFFSQNCDISFHRIATFLFTELRHFFSQNCDISFHRITTFLHANYWPNFPTISHPKFVIGMFNSEWQ